MRGKPDPLVAARIREQINSHHLSYRKLGTAIGVSCGQVFKYAHAVHRIPTETLAQIAAALGCSITDLMSDPEQRR
jgi:transcriptional regulator with XRE-family HTH domain